MQVNDPANPTKKLDDFWGPSQALLGDSTFMAQLTEFDKVRGHCCSTAWRGVHRTLCMQAGGVEHAPC